MMHAPIPTRPIEAPTAGPPVLPSVALFIDGDNIAPTRCAAVVAIAAREGRVQTARAYCNAQTLAGWAACPGVEVIHSGPGPGASDMAMAWDAALCATGGDGFAAAQVVLATSDGGFAVVAQRLRTRGVRVIGVGAAHAPEALRAACSRFVELAATRSTPAPDPVEAAVSAVLGAAGRDGLTLTRLNEEVRRAFPGKPSPLRGGTWRAFLTARPHLYRCDPPGQTARARLRA